MSSLFSQSPFLNLSEWILQGGNPGTERNLFGIIPAYPVFMFIGIIAVIISCLVKLKLRNIPFREFEWAIIIVVPAGILGGTIFGKIFIPNMIWYHVFFFWEPGMSLFGAIGIGTVAGFAWFYRRSKITKISVWVYADCILPNVLLGQAIGRWGNFFNHEILGQVVDYDALSWLIPSIRDKLWYFPQEFGEIGPLPESWWTMIHDAQGNLLSAAALASNLNISSDSAQILHTALENPLQFRQPLFLIESLLNFFYWIFLNFFIGNLSRMFQKKKRYPWDVQPQAYPGWFNQSYKSLSEEKIISWKTQNPIKYKRVLTNSSYELKMSLLNAWKKAYYWKELEPEVYQNLAQLSEQHQENQKLNESLLVKNKENYRQKVKKLKNNFASSQQKLTKAELAALKKQAMRAERQSFLAKKQTYYQNLGGRNYRVKPNPNAKLLEAAHNPDKFFILRCGVLSGMYVFGYTLYRVVLETFREPREFFIQNQLVANFIVLGIIVVFGLGLSLWAQFMSPKYRDVEWLYEKSY